MSAHSMSLVHRFVIAGSVVSAAVVWFLLRTLPDLTTAQTIFLMLFPGASLATACYCVCMVFNCMGRR